MASQPDFKPSTSFWDIALSRRIAAALGMTSTGIPIRIAGPKLFADPGKDILKSRLYALVIKHEWNVGTNNEVLVALSNTVICAE